MASYAKRGSVWRVQVRKAGQSHSSSFPTKEAARQWAISIEADILAGKLGNIPDKTFKDILDKYLKEVTPTKRGARSETLRINRTLRDDLAKVHLRDLKPEHVSQWRDRRLETVSNASVNREWNTLSNACRYAVKEWKWLRENPFSVAKRPKPTPPRQRIITQDEIDRVVTACGNDYSTAQGRVGLAFLFALETGMRAGEICALTWADVSEVSVYVAKSKNGFPRHVPLSVAACNIINNLAKFGKDCPVFNISEASLDALFRKAKARALVSGFTFHDARATALTRLSRVLNVMQLAKVSGHRDLRILQNVYYRESIEDIAAVINAA